MKRRSFIHASALSACAMAESPGATARATPPAMIRDLFSTDGNRASIRVAAAVKPTRVFHLTDTHLAIRDDREAPFRQYSDRMASAYQTNRHHLTNAAVSAEAAFEQTLALAKSEKADFLVFTGDILSFPSEAGIDWLLENLRKTAIPYAYIAGNHDWHYEGMPGSSQQLREIWTARRLKPLYQGRNPMFAAHDLNGIRFVAIDNSICEILPEQLEFFNSQTSSGLPLVLLMHIPLYVPGRPIDYSCGHPAWGPDTDIDCKLERREPWHPGGQSKATIDFHRAVFAAPNVIAILAGHTHLKAIDVKNNIPQLVGGHNATAYYYDIRILPGGTPAGDR